MSQAADPPLTVLSYNIHKGWGAWGWHYTLPAMREALVAVAPDLVLLQEVQGALAGPAAGRQEGQAEEVPQQEFLAASFWPYVAYGGNRFYRGGHHGNAVLSRYPIVAVTNHDLSAARRWESRGALEVVVAVGKRRVHCFSLHLGLRRRWRRWQLVRLREVVAAVPTDHPVIVGGDFNDWEGAADRLFAEPLGLVSVGGERRLRTYPARGWRLGALDRLYVRGMAVEAAAVLRAAPWPRLSDHLPIWTRLVIDRGGVGKGHR